MHLLLLSDTHAGHALWPGTAPDQRHDRLSFLPWVADLVPALRPGSPATLGKTITSAATPLLPGVSVPPGACCSPGRRRQPMGRLGGTILRLTIAWVISAALSQTTNWLRVFRGETLLTFPMVEDKNGRRLQCSQKNAWHALAASPTQCARSRSVLLVCSSGVLAIYTCLFSSHIKRLGRLAKPATS